MRSSGKVRMSMNSDSPYLVPCPTSMYIDVVVCSLEIRNTRVECMSLIVILIQKKPPTTNTKTAADGAPLEYVPG